MSILACKTHVGRIRLSGPDNGKSTITQYNKVNLVMVVDDCVKIISRCHYTVTCSIIRRVQIRMEFVVWNNSIHSCVLKWKPTVWVEVTISIGIRAALLSPTLTQRSSRRAAC